MPATASRRRPPASGPRPRLVWLDVARGLALLSMFTAHVAPSPGPLGVLNLSEFLTAALFAALVGASVDLEADRCGWPRAAGATLVRAAALAACGWLSGFLRADVVDVLSHLAVVMLLAVLLCRLPSAVLAGLGVLAATAGVWVTRAGPQEVMDWAAPLLQAGADPALVGTVVSGWLTSGPYRILLLWAYGLFGMVLVRLLRRSLRRTALVGAAAGAAVGAAAVFAARAQTGESPIPYTGTVAEVVLCLGLVAAALGLCAGLAPDRRPGADEVVGRRGAAGRRGASGVSGVSGLLAVPGSMTLTVYVAHQAYLGWGRVALGAFGDGTGLWNDAVGRDDTWFNLAVLSVGGILLPLLWRGVVRAEPWRRGPLEGPIRLLTGPIHGR